jgi:hypothetical protein
MISDNNLYSAAATTCWAAVPDRWLRGASDLKTIDKFLCKQKIFF